jgi:hypothetical protein
MNQAARGSDMQTHRNQAASGTSKPASVPLPTGASYYGVQGNANELRVQLPHFSLNFGFSKSSSNPTPASVPQQSDPSHGQPIPQRQGKDQSQGTTAFYGDHAYDGEDSIQQFDTWVCSIDPPYW